VRALTRMRAVTTVEPARATARLSDAGKGQLPSPAWRRLQPDARQPGVPPTGGRGSRPPPVDSAPLRPRRAAPQTIDAPPHRRGGARRLGRKDRGAHCAPHLRKLGPAASCAAQSVASGREGLGVGDARSRSRSAAPDPRGDVAGPDALAPPRGRKRALCSAANQSPPNCSPFLDATLQQE
jgi:hypothetical protein